MLPWPRANQTFRRPTSLALVAILTLFGIGAALAGPGGGGGGGHGGGGGGGHGGGGGGGGHASGGGHVGSAGHDSVSGHGGFGFHGGYGHADYGHGFGHRGHPIWGHPGNWRGAWGWGGIGLGWYLPFLPWGYETLFYEGVPYYYADDSYYVWDDSVGEYQAVEPPDALSESGERPPAVLSDPDLTLFAYPKAGQSDEQQARDRSECEQWASTQSGFDAKKGQQDALGEEATKRASYLHAEAACLEGRNYTVR